MMTDKLNHYLVILTLYLGEYEKMVHHFVLAESGDAASLMALRDESHNDVDRESPEEGQLWEDGGWLYEVYSCRQLTTEQAKVLDEVW